VDVGQWDQTLAILRATHFHPWEGWNGARDVFVRALRLRAEEHMRNGRYEEAIKDLTAAKEYPENLGSGRPHNPSFAYEDYHIGMCYKAMGKVDEARRSFKNVGAGSSPWHTKANEELRTLPQP
jgi:tetratricopeptide (TPR) repeat protein